MLAEQRKTPLFVRDTPGFLITRVLFGYWAEVVRLLVDGVSPVEIDGMLEAGGWPGRAMRVPSYASGEAA